MTTLCIIVFGISGVGKSAACSDYVARNPMFLHLRASELIRRSRSRATEDLRTVSESDIISNQELLEREVSSIKAEHPGRPLLIDGHAIIDNDQQLVRIPLQSIAALQPTAFILLEASPSAVFSRRDKDSRNRPKRTLAALELELAAEKNAASEYATALGIPIVIKNVDQGFFLDDAIEEAQIADR